MSNISINVHRKTVQELLRTGKDKLFLVPEYQRPYAWTEEEVENFFSDIWEFSLSNNLKNKDKKFYFLGSIVLFNEKEDEENSDIEAQVIIDGQQRITTLFLLLRAIYTNLEKHENSTNDKEIQNLINNIKPLIWETDFKNESKFDKPFLKSEATIDKNNKSLMYILENGEVENEKSNDNYTIAYLKLQKLINEKSKNNSVSMNNFYWNTFLSVILMPIETNSLDGALTIFNTLNNRGLQLSDADIFKSIIYKEKNNKDKATFIHSWKLLETRTQEASINVTNLFYHYMFYLRAKNNDKNTTTPKLRSFFLDKKQKNYDILISNELMNDLDILSKFFIFFKTLENPFKNETSINDNNDSELNWKWAENIEILKLFDILRSYPNDFGIYPIVVYFLTHRKQPSFEKNFKLFLQKLISSIFLCYIDVPSVVNLKLYILNLNIEIINNEKPAFNAFQNLDFNNLKQKIIIPHINIVRMVLKIIAYANSNQVKLLPLKKLNIEHIVPSSFIKYSKAIKNNNLQDGVEFDDKIIEEIGNKVLLEFQINVQASNHNFRLKQEKYKTSEIVVANELSELDKNQWNEQPYIQNSIKKRSEESINKINDILNKWNKEYNNN